MQLVSLIPARHNLAYAKWIFYATIATALFAVLLIVDYFEKTESTGHLWWKETRQLSDSERLPSLLWGIGLATLAATLLAAALWLYLHPALRAQRARYQRSVEKDRFQTQTLEGRAQRAFEEGDAGFAAELRVDDGSHWQILRKIEAEGWMQTEQRLHKRTHTTSVTAHPHGGHTVERTSTQNATFYFARRRGSP